MIRSDRFAAAERTRTRTLKWVRVGATHAPRPAGALRAISAVTRSGSGVELGPVLGTYHRQRCAPIQKVVQRRARALSSVRMDMSRRSAVVLPGGELLQDRDEELVGEHRIVEQTEAQVRDQLREDLSAVRSLQRGGERRL